MTGPGPAFSFWLHYLDHHGGLWEQSGDTVLAILPAPLRARHDLPESALITGDPDIAREDGVLFFGAGHPEIVKGADLVLDSGDVGALTLPHATKQISTEDLLAKIRDQVPVDHGRIDATGSVLRSHRPVLRLAALVTHSVSVEDQLTEVAECLLDVPSNVALAPDAADRLIRATGAAEATRGPALQANGLVPALAAAYRALDHDAARRSRELRVAAEAERVAEITRAREYYAAALAAIDQRRGSADAARLSLLEAKTSATVAERDRRVAEIDEKYRGRHELRPYRLHLLDVPVWRLATDVRRGDRRWPVVFDYVPLLGTVAAVRCPTCGAHASLVATKTQLVCDACTPVRPAAVVAPPPAAPQAKTPPKPREQHPPPPKTASPPASKTPAARTATRRPFVPGRPEERRVVDFWNQVGAGETRKVARLVAPDSPLSALVRLFDAAGPLHGVGVPVGHALTSFTSGHYDEPVLGQRGATAGELSTHRGRYPYLLLWSPDRLLEEVLPYSHPWHPGRVEQMLSPLTRLAVPRGDLDAVATLLLRHVAAEHSVTFAARALAAWWRLPDPDALVAKFSARVLAASVDRAVRYWSGAYGAGYADAAECYQADPAEMRRATVLLQKHLSLSPTRNW